MAVAEARPLVVNPANLRNIESFLTDVAYKEAIENSANYNTRLCVERRLRMPFLDPQTGVAQNHCGLFMSEHQRMPGAREGQIYTYPAARWRKARRQYLSYSRSGRWGSGAWGSGFGLGGPDGVDGPGLEATGDGASLDAHDTDSKDSHQRDAQTKDDPKEWFYDDMGMEELDQFDEPEPESDEDYCDENYSNRRRRGGGGGGRSGGAGGAGGGAKGKRSRGGNDSSRSGANDASDSPVPKRGRGAGRGRKKTPQAAPPPEAPGDSDKPHGCELCGARYKTRPGLNYHYSHSHKEAGGSAGSDGDSRDSPARPVAHQGVARSLDPAAAAPSSASASASVSASTAASAPAVASAASAQTVEYQDSYVTFLNNPSAPHRRVRPSGVPAGVADENSASGLPSSPAPTSPPPRVDDEVSRSSEPPLSPSASRLPSGAAKPSPSPYCDFCLGDQRENKKTGAPEELVSCSDCGRSGEFKDGKDHDGVDKNGRDKTNGHDDDDATSACDYLLNMRNRIFSEDDFDNFARNLRIMEPMSDDGSSRDGGGSPPSESLQSPELASGKPFGTPLVYKRHYRKKYTAVHE